MATVRMDLIKDANARVGENSTSVVRSIVVEDLAGAAAARMLEAISSCGVAYGQSHPNVPLLIARDFTATAMSDTVAEVLVTYSKLELNTGGQVMANYRASLQGELVDEDITNPGKPILVQHWQKDADVGNMGIALLDGRGEQGLTINCLRPVGNLYVTKYVTLASDDTTSFTTLEDAYFGRANNATWRGRPKHSWLCTGFVAERMGTRNYKLDLTFSYHPKTWYAWGRYVDPYTGKPPSNAKKNETQPEKSNAWKRVQAYAEADFANLYTALGTF